VISIVSPQTTTYAKKSIPLIFTVDEPTSWIGYSLDGQSNVTTAVNTTLAGLAEGLHSIVVYANDTSGNMGTSNTVSFMITLPYGPEAEFTWIPLSPSVAEIVRFDASATKLGFNGTHSMPITEYHWDFDDDNKTTTSTPIVYHSFSNLGSYDVTLTVYAPGATPGTDSITHNVTVTSAPVGGYSFPIDVNAIAKPLALSLALVAIVAIVLTLIKRKTRRSSKLLEQAL